MREEDIKWIKGYIKRKNINLADIINPPDIERMSCEALAVFRLGLEQTDIRINARLELKPLGEHLAALIDNQSSYSYLYQILQKKVVYSERYYRDVMRFLYFSLLIDTERFYIFYKQSLFEHKRIKKYQKQKTELIRSIKNNTQTLRKNYKLSLVHLTHKEMQGYRDVSVNSLNYLQAQKKIETLLQGYEHLGDELTTLLEQREDEHFFHETEFDKNVNYLLSREIASESGIRNLCLRYTACILQICGVEYTGTILFKLMEKLMPQEFLVGFIENDALKIVKDIDINNTAQSYLETFDGLFHTIIKPNSIMFLGNIYSKARQAYEYKPSLENSGLKPYFQQWYDEQLTFIKYKDFAHSQRLRHGINNPITFIFEE